MARVGSEPIFIALGLFQCPLHTPQERTRLKPVVTSALAIAEVWCSLDHLVRPQQEERETSNVVPHARSQFHDRCRRSTLAVTTLAKLIGVGFRPIRMRQRRS